MNETIFFGMPIANRSIDIQCAIATFKTLARVGGESYFHWGISDIALARNIVIHKFLKSNCEWIMMIDSDIIFTDRDFDLLWNGDDLIVTAPYARKIPGTTPALFGLGFTRVHRKVFEKIQELENKDGSETAQKFYMDGEIYTHFFPNGVTGDSRWLGEDRGFFTLCAMTGIPYRMEDQCRLQHAGSFLFGYPDQSNGATWWTAEPEFDVPNDPRPVVEM